MRWMDPWYGRDLVWYSVGYVGNTCLSRYGNAGIVMEVPKSAGNAGFWCRSSSPGVVIFVKRGIPGTVKKLNLYLVSYGNRGLLGWIRQVLLEQTWKCRDCDKSTKIRKKRGVLVWKLQSRGSHICGGRIPSSVWNLNVSYIS